MKKFDPTAWHYILIALGMICATVCIALGKENTVLRILATLAGAGTGVGLAFLRSILTDKENKDA